MRGREKERAHTAIGHVTANDNVISSLGVDFVGEILDCKVTLLDFDILQVKFSLDSRDF